MTLTIYKRDIVNPRPAKITVTAKTEAEYKKIINDLNKIYIVKNDNEKRINRHS